jgi:hypothetical protein
MKRNLVIVAAVCACLAACRPSRTVSFEQDVAAAPQSVVVAKADTAPAPDPDPDPAGTFAFPDDSGGKIFAKILPPPEPGRLPPERKTGPKPRKGLAALEQPEPPLAAPAATIPGVAQPKRSPLRPRPLPDAAPLAFLHDDPAVPQRPELPPAVLVRQRARDVNELLALAPQVKPVADRAPLDDPTAEFSTQRAAADQPAMRSTPVPFTRVNLPDPFENRAATKVVVTEPPVVAPVPALPK